MLHSPVGRSADCDEALQMTKLPKSSLAPWWRAPQVAVIFGLIVMALLLSGIVVHRTTMALHEKYRSETDARNMLTQIEQIRATMAEVESDVRDYLIIGEDASIQSFQKIKESLQNQFQLLRE